MGGPIEQDMRDRVQDPSERAQRGQLVRSPSLLKITGVPVRSGQLAVLTYLVVVAASFFYWGPILYGITIPEGYFQSIMWLPSWS